MNGYICFYKNKRIEVKAETSYKAQLAAAKEMKVKKPYMISVILAEKDGVQVVHKPLM